MSMVETSLILQHFYNAFDIDNRVTKIEKELPIMKGTVLVALPAAGWTGSAAPYSQTVTVTGMKDTMEPILVSNLPTNATVDQQKAYNKAFGIISSGVGTVGNDSVTFKVYKKPTIDITIGLKGE